MCIDHSYHIIIDYPYLSIYLAIYLVVIYFAVYFEPNRCQPCSVPCFLSSLTLTPANLTLDLTCRSGLLIEVYLKGAFTSCVITIATLMVSYTLRLVLYLDHDLYLLFIKSTLVTI